MNDAKLAKTIIAWALIVLLCIWMYLALNNTNYKVRDIRSGLEYLVKLDSSYSIGDTVNIDPEMRVIIIEKK